MREFFINEIRLNDYMDILSVSESVLPPFDTDRTYVPGQPGSLFIRQTIGERVIKVEFNLRAESFEERSEKINGLTSILYTGSEYEVTTPNGRTYKVVLDGATDLANALYDGYGQLSFLASDPIAYGKLVTEELIFGNQHSYRGTYETAGTIQIFSDGSPRIKVQLNTAIASVFDFVEINDVFFVGDVVIIDLENETVVKNGFTIMDKVNWLGNFFKIKPGSYSISTEGGNAFFTYRERWI